MREVFFTPDLANALLAFERAGGVVDFVLIEPTTQDGPPELLHRSAAVFGLKVVDQRLQAYAQANASSEYPSSHFFRLTWQEDHAVGRPIDMAEFLGPPTDSALAQGFVSALRHPPYADLSGAPFDPLFHSIVQGVLGPHDGPLSIYAWSTNWSNYFDAGLEWWGAHLWTVQRADGLIAWIGASSTD
jgi:hypothetical protein